MGRYIDKEGINKRNEFLFSYTKFQNQSYSLTSDVMKKAAISTCLIILALLTSNVGSSQSNADYKTRIETINKEMVKSMLEGNTEKLLNLYTDDAISMPNYQPMMDGLAAIRKSSEEMIRGGLKYHSFAPTTLKVIGNGDQITEIGTFKINLTLPNTTSPIDDQGKYLNIWEKQKDGSLKIKYQIWNTDVNPMVMANPSAKVK
jgi:ketosteroid isomerase-like protein